MEKEQVLKFLEATLNGGDLELLIQAVDNYDITSTEVTECQAYLQGVLYSFELLSDITQDEINELDVPKTDEYTTTELIKEAVL